MVFIHCTGGPDITLTAHNRTSRRAADAQVTLTEPVPAVSVHFMYVLYSMLRRLYTEHCRLADCPSLVGLHASLHCSLFVCQGMLGIPPNCERASCMAYVQWTPVDNNNIQFELEATAPGWVAVGVSADQVMGGNGIDDVFACQRDATDDTVYAQDTFNPQDQATRANTRDSVSVMMRM